MFLTSSNAARLKSAWMGVVLGEGPRMRIHRLIPGHVSVASWLAGGGEYRLHSDCGQKVAVASHTPGPETVECEALLPVGRIHPGATGEEGVRGDNCIALNSKARLLLTALSNVNEWIIHSPEGLKSVVTRPCSQDGGRGTPKGAFTPKAMWPTVPILATLFFMGNVTEGFESRRNVDEETSSL
ncbi:hypothetical protein EYF80_021218 [Liparis tanakae]|uniref:Uncharacterized protein n=1 Tax=Liparis tanakae TaxID=230148 RepID=A0A4Z2HUI9_9TELE|nr:hypothetical protein EYF80_021218 [Liparis tanakae]